MHRSIREAFTASFRIIEINKTLNTLVEILFWFIISYLCCYKLWLSSVVPFTVPQFNPHDQTWFFNTARSINTNDWLVEYNHFTLIKGPVYSMFMSVTSDLGINFKFAINLTYVLSCISFLFALKTFIANRLALLVAFTLLIANPVTFSDVWTQPMRENLYISLILVYLSSIIALISLSIQNDNKKAIYVWSLFASITLALAWNTREESIWLIPCLIPLIIVALFQLFTLRTTQLILPILTIIFSSYTFTSYLASKNSKQFGINVVSEFKGTQYIRAFNAIISLNTEINKDPYLYLSNTSIKKLKSISEATNKVITPLLKEDELTLVGPHIKYGAFTSWAIRDSMYYNGYYRNAQKTENAYKEIADDIENYCSNNAGECRKIYLSGMLIKGELIQNIIPSAIKAIEKITNFSYTPPSLDQLRTTNTRARLRGAEEHQSLVNRFLHIDTQYNAEMEEKHKLEIIERYRKKKINKLHKQYSQNIGLLFILTISIFLIFSLVYRDPIQILIGLLLIGSFTASISIFIILETFVINDFGRALLSPTIPMLVFISSFLAIGIQQTYNEFFTLINNLLRKYLLKS